MYLCVFFFWHGWSPKKCLLTQRLWVCSCFLAGNSVILTFLFRSIWVLSIELICSDLCAKSVCVLCWVEAAAAEGSLEGFQEEAAVPIWASIGLGTGPEQRKSRTSSKAFRLALRPRCWLLPSFKGSPCPALKTQVLGGSSWGHEHAWTQPLAWVFAVRLTIASLF